MHEYNLVDESNKNVGRNDVPALQSPTSVGSPAAYEHVEPTNTVELDVNDELQPETQQSPGVPKPKGKKVQQNQRNITTKTRRKKIPLTFHLFPLMESRFISKKMFKDGGMLCNERLQMR